MADDNNNENQENQENQENRENRENRENQENQENRENRPENNTSTSYINQLRGSDTVEDALTAHIKLWEEAGFQKANQQPGRSQTPLGNITQQQSSDEDNNKRNSKKGSNSKG